MIIVPQIVIDNIKREATSKLPRIIDEKNYEKYVEQCSHFHAITGTVIIYTLDDLQKIGLKHKSLRYALHLTLGFRHPIRRVIAPITNITTAKKLYNNIPMVKFNWQLAVEWVRLFLPKDKPRWREGNGENSSKYPEPVNFYCFTDGNWQPYNVLPTEAEHELLHEYFLQRWTY